MTSQGNAHDTFSVVPSTEAEYLLPGSFVDRVWRLERTAGENTMVIGRWGDHDVAIPDYSISRTHCTFRATAKGMTIEDAGSRNGTFVNGNPLDAGVAFVLAGNETITLGRFNFIFLTGAQFLELLVQRVMESRGKKTD